MELRGFLGDIMRAIGFLSRFPVPSRFFSGEPLPASALSGAFPAAGVLILLPAAALLWLLLALGADPLLAALIALSVQIACCGALHEDGLADAIDGLFGGRSRERALEIMKDSRVGSYGVIAMCLSIAIRAAAIAAVARVLPALDAVTCLLAAAAVSRALMVWHWASLPPARADGVAAAAGMPRPAAMHAALMIGLLLAVALLAFTVPVFALIVALVAAGAGVAAFTGLVRGKIGGHTGDTIGACQQIAEIAVLIGLAVAA